MKRTLILIAALAALLLLAACATPPSTQDADPSMVLQAPEEVTRAHDVVLDFLYEAAFALTPPENATWTLSGARPGLPEGFEYYFYSSGDAVMSVSYPEPAGPDTVYHVTIGDSVTSLCWQANVSASGEMLETGTAADLSLGDQNPAAIYCEAQGGRYEIYDEPSGGQCSRCYFDDGSYCRSWAYLRGQCQPGDFLSQPES